MLTSSDVQQRVEQIAALVDDDESAHAAEDKLHFDVLTAIANDDCEDPSDCAAVALETSKLPFRRWRA